MMIIACVTARASALSRCACVHDNRLAQTQSLPMCASERACRQTMPSHQRHAHRTDDGQACFMHKGNGRPETGAAHARIWEIEQQAHAHGHGNTPRARAAAAALAPGALPPALACSSAGPWDPPAAVPRCMLWRRPRPSSWAAPQLFWRRRNLLEMQAPWGPAPPARSCRAVVGVRHSTLQSDDVLARPRLTSHDLGLR